jgi:hypothetical protein
MSLHPDISDVFLNVWIDTYVSYIHHAFLPLLSLRNHIPSAMLVGPDFLQFHGISFLFWNYIFDILGHGYKIQLKSGTLGAGFWDRLGCRSLPCKANRDFFKSTPVLLICQQDCNREYRDSSGFG